MEQSLKVYCKNIDSYVDINGGDTLFDVYNAVKDKIAITPICAHVNYKTEGLSFRIYSPKHVEFIDASHPSGNRVYIRSLCMILYKALAKFYPGMRLRIEHSISKGYFCRIYGLEITPEVIATLKAEMQAIVDADLPFVRHERLTKDVVEMFRQQGLADKVALLETSQELYTVYYTLGDIADSYYSALAPSTGYIKYFDLVPDHDGMILLGRSKTEPNAAERPVPQEKMFEAFAEHTEFNVILGIDDVGSLNKAVQSNQTSMLINVAEALHSKVFSRIAYQIAERHKRGEARIVLISGPSSSGKTTSTKRLAIQLMTHFIRPKMISLDNYFVNREDTPLDENGEYDYESLYALDLEQFNADLNTLLAGGEVKMPTYDFEQGKRVYKGDVMKLDENDVLLIEGIHGLNPELTRQVPDNQKFKLYISALTTLSIDDHNWIPTRDNRLLRRIIRDHKYRGVSARDTIARWQSVGAGEDKWIFPFQENADATFNSSLIFELGVMKEYAEPILKKVPRDVPEYAEAQRLRTFLDYFLPISERQIPSTSLLREFLGGSSFHY